MKSAIGELNLTVITLIALAAVIGFFWLMWPSIRSSLNTQWNTVSNRDAAEDFGAGYIVKGYEIVVNK